MIDMRKRRLESIALLTLLVATGVAMTPRDCAGVPAWTSPNRYRVLLTVDPRGITRSNSPASVDIDLAQALSGLGATGAFDESTVEVFAYNAGGGPMAYDLSLIHI